MKVLVQLLFTKSKSQFLHATKVFGVELMVALLKGVHDHQASCQESACLLTNNPSYFKKFIALTMRVREHSVHEVLRKAKQMLAQSVSAAAKIFYLIFKTSKVFNMINFLAALKAFYLNSLLFSSSLIYS